MSVERLIRTMLDVGCVLVGLGGIIHQTVIVPPGQATEALLIAYVSILGIPAGVGLLSLRGGSGTTGGPSSSPPSVSLQPPSSSPSPASGGGDRP